VIMICLAVSTLLVCNRRRDGQKSYHSTVRGKIRNKANSSHGVDYGGHLAGLIEVVECLQTASSAHADQDCEGHTRS